MKTLRQKIAQLFGAKTPDPVVTTPHREPVHHDMRRTYWSHNISVVETTEDGGRTWVWSTPAVKVGDTITWLTQYGEITVRAVDVERMLDPDDMAMVAYEVVDRKVK